MVTGKEDYPILITGVNLYIGAMKGLDKSQNRKIRNIADEIKIRYNEYINDLVGNFKDEFDLNYFAPSPEGANEACKWIDNRLEEDGYLEAFIDKYNNTESNRAMLHKEDSICFYRYNNEVKLPKRPTKEFRDYVNRNSDLLNYLEACSYSSNYCMHFIYISNLVITIKNWPLTIIIPKKYII